MKADAAGVAAGVQVLAERERYRGVSNLAAFDGGVGGTRRGVRRWSGFGDMGETAGVANGCDASIGSGAGGRESQDVGAYAVVATGVAR